MYTVLVRAESASTYTSGPGWNAHGLYAFILFDVKSDVFPNYRILSHGLWVELALVAFANAFAADT